MTILQGTIFEGPTRLFRNPLDSILQKEFFVTEGPFLVEDESGDYESLIVGEIPLVLLDDEYEVFNDANGGFEVADGVGGHEVMAVKVSAIRLGAGTISEFDSVNDHIDQYEQLNSQLSALSFRPPGRGGITALLELNNVVYAARTLADNSGSQLYRPTDTLYLNKEVEWEPVDMGHEVAFDNGTTEPLTIYDREFLDIEFTPSDPITDRRPSAFSSIATIRSTTGAGFDNGTWQEVESLYTKSTDAVAFAIRRPSANPTGEHFSQTLQLRGFVSDEDADPNVRITGFEVKLAYEQEVRTTSTDSPYGLLSVVRLLNVDGSDNKGSTDVADRLTMDIVGAPSGLGNKYTTGLIETTFGSDSDTWGASSLDTSRVLNKDFGVEIEMGARIGQLTSGVRPSRQFFIHDCTLTVYFEDGTERVFFWDGDNDVAEADVVSVNKTEGSWSMDNAQGYLTLYNTNNPQNIVSGLQIRSAAGGSGSLMAMTSADATRNLLPSWDEFLSNRSLAQHIKANFFIDESKEAIYGVTGAGPAYTFDGRFFRFIHAPIPLEKDKPRHIIEHESHLVLAYPSGSILISVVGQPTNFSGIDGASEFGYGDVITDLAPLPGAALAVLCRQSAHALVGTTIDNFSNQVISKTSGAIEYSAVSIGPPIYADFRGISSITNTNQFGDFLAGRLSQRVTQLIQGRIQDISGVSVDLQDLVCAIPVRNRNQYKIFFNDGFILTMTLFGGADEIPVFTVQKYGADKDTLLNPNSTYVPTAILSTVLSRGTELNMFGTRSGDIYVMNQGTGILTARGIQDYYATLTFNPFNGGEPHSNIKYNEILIHGRTSGGQELVTSAGVNYLIPEPSTQTDEITMGQLDSGFNINLIPQKKSTHLPNVTSGFSLKIESQADGNLPHIIQALTFRPTLVGDQSVGQKRYVGPIDADM